MHTEVERAGVKRRGGGQLIALAFLVSLLGSGTLSAAEGGPVGSGGPLAGGNRDVAQVWAEVCANCHGAGMEGGMAPSMLDDVWVHGGDDASLAKSIREGSPTAGMPPFGAALSDEEIRAMVVYIQETSNRARNERLFRKPGRPIQGLEFHSELHNFHVEEVASDIRTPWGIEFLPDDRMIVTECPGGLVVIENGKGVVERISGLPPIFERQDGGLMDVELHPDYAHTGWIYLALSELGGTEEGASSVRIVRGRIRDGKWVDEETLFKPPPELYWKDTSHYGARFVFDMEGHLFFTIGDRGSPEDAQDLSSPYGKVHRIFDDGRIPPDNPFVGTPGAVKSIWTYGNRNPEGIVFDSVTGDLWSTEHGPRGGDELNLILRGHNYGWPVITHGINYDGTPISNLTEKEGMDQPVVHWTPSIAVCAVEYYTGGQFPRWKNQLFVTALGDQELRRLELDGHTVVHQEVLFRRYGRVRDVVTGPDGYLYVALNQPDLIVRLVPDR